MSKTVKIVIWLVVIVIVIAIGASLSKKGSNPDTGTGPIKIGFIGPLTGDTAGIGENVRAAVEVARDEINAAGGVNKRQVEVIFEDGQCDPKAAANAGNKLVSVDKVVAIIGGLCSSETLAVAPIAEQAKVPLISDASTNPKITDAGDYIFRFVPSDLFQGKFDAEYIMNTMKKSKVGILYCLSDWCTGIKDVFKQNFASSGTVVDEEGYQQDARDLRSQITKIKAAKPDVIYFLGYSEASIVGLKQLQELGVKTPIFGGDAWDDVKIAEGAGKAANGAMFSVTASSKYPQSFIDAMTVKKADKELNNYSGRGYDILKVLADIIGRVGVDSTKIKDELYKVKDYQGIGDTYTLDAKGDLATANYSVKKFQDSKIVLVQ
ncbi:MAG: ABC transporter substrate-binding protein [Candidatus Liptonbacteria bacterium]|nr:ABC transporter substrate-binding protein [Candidatus Liptonbacteria bacterium]